jgi:hypothetical protein
LEEDITVDLFWIVSIAVLVGLTRALIEYCDRLKSPK